MKQTETPYRHAEAFRIMQYRCNGGHTEYIWNSRDGVTPFMLKCRHCERDTTHVNWRGDVLAPDHQLKPGDRFWRDGTHEEAREIMRQRIEMCRGTAYERSEADNQRMVEECVDWDDFQSGWPMLDERKESGS